MGDIPKIEIDFARGARVIAPTIHPTSNFRAQGRKRRKAPEKQFSGSNERQSNQRRT